MKVKTIVRFQDIENNKIRELNDVFEVNAKRAATLIQKKFVDKVEEPKKESAD